LNALPLNDRWTVESVNGALKQARASLQRRSPLADRHGNVIIGQVPAITAL
jgi:hypothetical protein